MCFAKMNGSQIEIEGVATLCFSEDGTWFQGSICTEDDSQFAIYGTKSLRKRVGQGQSSSSEGGDCALLEEGPGVPVTFDIKIVDCEMDEEYSLKRVNGRNGELCTFSCSCISFTTDNVYRGHKADLISKQCLGHKMEGKKTNVYRGPIRVTCMANPRNVHWVL